MMRQLSIVLLTLTLLIVGDAVLAQPKEAVTVTTVTTKAGGSFNVEKTLGIDPRYYPLMRRLTTSGFTDSIVRKCFGDERTVFIPKAVWIKPPSRNASSDKAAYAWVNTDESSELCIKFLKKYEKTLQSAQKAYGVDAELIVALLRCETRHGTITGDYHLFSAFASMSLQNDSVYLDSSIRRARADMTESGTDSTVISDQITALRARASKRGGWAYKELMNCLRMYQHGTNMLEIYGSWAGAFGWCQFLPSSYLKFAVDGNGDKKVDLFNSSDAIYSVANYLSKAGYRSGDTGRMRKALFNYNNSTAYVESIMGLAERIKTTLNPPPPQNPTSPQQPSQPHK